MTEKSTQIVQDTKSIKATQKQIDKQSKWLLKTSELSLQTWNLLLEVIDAFGNAAKIEENKKNEFRNEFRNEFKKSFDELEGKMKKLSKLQILLQNMCDEKSPVKRSSLKKSPSKSHSSVVPPPPPPPLPKTKTTTSSMKSIDFKELLKKQKEWAKRRTNFLKTQNALNSNPSPSKKSPKSKSP
jgi:hypothetical protein